MHLAGKTELLGSMLTFCLCPFSITMIESLPALFEMTSGTWELIVVRDACYDDSLEYIKTAVMSHWANSTCVRVRVRVVRLCGRQVPTTLPANEQPDRVVYFNPRRHPDDWVCLQ